MDTVQIGKFLSELRREHHLTQEQLGEKLGVTNKTVSRWETGSYMPPADMLLTLSGFYGISINEILSGKRITADDDYKAAAEENLKRSLREKEESAFTYKDRLDFFRRKWKKDHAAAMIFETVLLIGIFAAGIAYDNRLEAAAFFAGAILSIINRNKMMAYAEMHTFRISDSTSDDQTGGKC